MGIIFIFCSNFYWIACTLIILSISSQVNALQLILNDNDVRGGWISGNLKISDPNPKEKDLKYEIFWGNNPNNKLGQYRPLTRFSRSDNGSLNLKIHLKNLRIPPGATHFIISSVLENNQSYPILSYPIIDLGVPTYKAEGLSFQQTRSEAGRIQGEIRIVPAFNERDIVSYAVYWGSAEDVVIRSEGSLVVIPKPGFFGSLWRGINQPWTEPGNFFEIDKRLPPDATHLIVFTRNEEGQMSEGMPFNLETEEEEVLPVVSMKWEPTKSDKGFIAGTVEMERLEDESGFTHYLLAWGRDSETRMDQYPILAQYEVRGIRDGIMEKDLKIETLGPMDQKLNITVAQDEGLKLAYTFTEKQRIPIGATHLLLLTQRKFWFEEDAERKIGKVIASVPLDDSVGLDTEFKVVRDSIDTEPTPLEVTEASIQGPRGSDWRDAQYRGIGLGISFSGLNSMVLSYDYNSSPDTQWHLQFDLTGPMVQSWFSALQMTGIGADMGNIAGSSSGSSLEISRSLVSLGYRWFVDPDWVWGLSEGLFYGAGLGYGTATLNYSGKYSTASSSIGGGESFSATQTVYSHNTSSQGMTVSLEAGWQGYENYMVHLALQPTFYVGYKDGYDETKIMPELNHQSTVSERWEKTRNLNRLTLGVGLFF
jgi:hypothetical protein